ncbi:hypothetical protein MUK42_21224 [Musa troglodytarum]|uniref:Uncharacterized protein n=1 Tax=Musa troglodytarum TaxID=320322 RepID=A0A9E7JGE7_9LILI|nr:hypothetical protein MUK42_21224 [Musa troglodytarum]
MRWQTIVCALIVAAPAVAAVALVGRAKPLLAVDLWAPCCGGVHPSWLLAYRGLVFLAMGWLLFRTPEAPLLVGAGKDRHPLPSCPRFQRLLACLKFHEGLSDMSGKVRAPAVVQVKHSVASIVH